MKKMIGSLLVLLLGAMVTQAQKQEPANPQQDKMNFKGYTIRVLPAPGGTYGYDIFKDRQLVLHQRGNPFTGSPLGLLTKDDVYKLAKWQIQNSQQRPPEPRTNPQRPVRGWDKLAPSLQARLNQAPAAPQQPLMNRRLPLQVARELNIRLHR